MKKCKYDKCNNNSFSGGYCKYHVYLNEKYKNKPLKKISSKRSKENKEYLLIKKDIRLEMIYEPKKRKCVFCNNDVKYDNINDFDIHHINKERNNYHLYDKKYLYPSHRNCHTIYHSFDSYRLINNISWYRDYVKRLRSIEYDLYLKELRKLLKASIITIKTYNDEANKQTN